MIFNFFKNKDEDDDKSYEEYDRLKEKLKKAKLQTMQKNYDKELKTLGLEYDMFK